MKREVVSVLFSDVAGYSKLTEAQLKVYFERALPAIAKILDPHAQEFIEINTWGDGLLLVTANPYHLARTALELRDFFKKTNWEADLLPKDLGCRIALHTGVVYLGHDAIRHKEGIVGTQINLGARIEPITPVNEIWTTEQFNNLIEPLVDTKLAFDDQGETKLAKNFGARRLFRLRWSSEPTNPVILNLVEKNAEEEQTGEKKDADTKVGIEPTFVDSSHLTSEMLNAFSSRDYIKGAEIYREILSHDKDELSKKKTEILYLYLRHTSADDAAALSRLKELAREQDCAEDAFNHIGKCYEKSREYESAATAFREAAAVSSK